MKSENNLKGLLYVALFVVAFVLTWLGTAHCQVTVAIAPDPHPQFLNSSGQPLASGFLYTYAAGTTTRQDTYIDSTGTVTNPWPIPLDATGSPTNGSVQTGIWLANQAYKFCAYNSALVQQWCTDNITSYLAIQNAANTWTAQQIFSLPIIDTAIDNQLVFGAAGVQTTLDFPPPAANITLHMPNGASQNILGSSGPAMNLPTFNGGSCAIVNGPATYACFPNANPTGTTLNTLTILANAPSQATIATTSTTLGVVGIAVAGAGSSGTATVQQTGTAACVFDGATTAGDYVTISTTTAGDCHDAGPSPPGFQNIGNVLSTNGSGGTFGILMAGSGGSGARTVCASGASVTVNASTTNNQNLEVCQLPTGALNFLNKTVRITGSMVITPGSAITSNITFGFGPTGPPFATNITIASETSSGTGYTVGFEWTCATNATGSSGNMNCSYLATSQGGTVTFGQANITNVNLTGLISVGSNCNFSSASTGNSCSEGQFLVEQLN